jgi:hypothetical protein
MDINAPVTHSCNVSEIADRGRGCAVHPAFRLHTPTATAIAIAQKYYLLTTYKY